MPSLKELLDELEIKTDDLDDKSNESNQDKDQIDLKAVKLDDIPEAQRPIFKKLIDTTENLTNELSKRDIMLEALKGAIPKERREEKREKVKDTSDEKILGVLDPSDPYAPAFKTLAEMIGSIKEEKTRDSEANWKNNLIAFAKEHKDIVRYAKDMDRLAETHPTLVGDIPTLYQLAKSISEGRAAKTQNKVDDLERQRNAKRFSTETSGRSNQDVVDVVHSKSITEAFDAAEKNLSNRR